MGYPSDVRYTKEHEWARLADGVVTVGITGYATEQLGDVVFVELPAAGKKVEDLHLPQTARLISVVRDGRAEIAVGSTELQAGDQVLAILEPGSEADLKSVLLSR